MNASEVATIVGGDVSLALFSWPDDWPVSAQATLAAAIIAPVVGLVTAVVSAGLKWWFDLVTLKTTNQLTVRSSMLKEFHSYAGNYIIPLSVASGELASYLEQYETLKELEFESPEKEKRKSEAAERAFYHLTRFVKYRTAMTSTFSLRDVEAPLGVFLVTNVAERRVWSWTPQLWALNVWNLEDEASLVDSLDNERRSGGEALAFLKSIREDGSTLNNLFTSFVEWMEKNKHLSELVTVLYALNALLSYELARVYSAWYKDDPREPKEEIAAIEGLSKEAKERMGLF